MPVLCIDCRYCDSDAPVPLCTHPVNRSLVDGKPLRRSCSETREPTGRCGPSGSLFETKLQVEPGPPAQP